MQVDLDLLGAVDDVVVGDDDAFLAVDDEAGAERRHHAVGARAAVTVVEELVEVLVIRRALRHARQRQALRALHRLAGRDVDDRLDQPLGDRGDRLRAARLRQRRTARRAACRRSERHGATCALNPTGVLRPRRPHADHRLHSSVSPAGRSAGQPTPARAIRHAITSGRGKWMASRDGCQRGPRVRFRVRQSWPLGRERLRNHRDTRS